MRPWSINADMLEYISTLRLHSPKRILRIISWEVSSGTVISQAIQTMDYMTGLQNAYCTATHTQTHTLILSHTYTHTYTFTHTHTHIMHVSFLHTHTYYCNTKHISPYFLYRTHTVLPNAWKSCNTVMAIVHTKKHKRVTQTKWTLTATEWL